MIGAIESLIKRRGSSRRGFTLVELMVVISVMAIGMAIAIPSFLVWLPGYRLRSAARDMGSTFQLARLKSASTVQECRVVINLNKNPRSVHVEMGNAPLNSTVWTCETGLYKEIHSDITGITITPAATAATGMNVCRGDGSTETGASGYRLVFRPNGSTDVGTEFKVVFTNTKGNQYQVTVSNTTGRVKVERP